MWNSRTVELAVPTCKSRYLPPSRDSGSNALREQTYLRAAEAAAFLHLNEKLLAKWRHYGRGPAYYKPAAKTVLYAQADLDAWLQTKRRATASLTTPSRSRANARLASASSSIDE